MPSDPEHPSPGPAQTDAQDGRIQPVVPVVDQTGVTAEDAAKRREVRKSMLVRLLLITLSAGGVIAAALFWSAGHPSLAARIVAGDLAILIAMLLLL